MSKLPPFPGFNDDVKVGTTFSNREAVRMAGLHNQIQAGICFHSTDDKSAFSVVTRDKGGYIDDEDYGDELLYTGQGGRDNNTGKHIADQELKRGNRALVVSYELQKPIHLIRGFTAKGSTPAFYRYDGLFNVENYWIEKGRAGFKVFRFRLVEINVIENKEINIPKKTFQVTAEGNENPGRKTVTTSSPIRDQKLAKQVKELYEYKCQICDIQINVPTGFYAESAHIKPLGKPHHGPDKVENIICLCPNHHVMFDNYTFTIDDNFDLIGIEGSLKVDENHNIDQQFLKYHRNISNLLIAE